MEIKTKNELKEITTTNSIVIARFHAEWCGPCKMLDTFFADLEKENEENIKFVGIDVEEADEELIEEMNISHIPTVFYYKDGLIVDKTVGGISKKTLLEKITEVKNR